MKNISRRSLVKGSLAAILTGTAMSRTALAQAVAPPDGLGLAKLQVGGNQEQDVGTPPGQRPPDLWLLQPHALRDGTHKLPPVRRHLRRQRLAAGLAGGSFGNRNGLAGRMSPATMRTLPRL